MLLVSMQLNSIDWFVWFIIIIQIIRHFKNELSVNQSLWTL